MGWMAEEAHSGRIGQRAYRVALRIVGRMRGKNASTG
jgi:hypothetical protein